MLTARPDKDGYLRVKVNGRRVPVHHVVMDAWLGPCPPGQERRHGTGGNQDNSVGNLCYGTHLENEQDKKRHKAELEAAAARPSLLNPPSHESHAP